MQLNFKKCKEMLIDFRRNKSIVPPITAGDLPLVKATTYKLLGIWVDDDLKWRSNTEFIFKKAVKRLHLLKVLKSYGAPKKDLLFFILQ